MEPGKPLFFETPAAFRAWLDEHHADATELWVGMYRKASGRPSITWREAVDEALCFGWIDGIRKGYSDDAYMNRFTPRRARSNWSAINVARVQELIKEGRMRPAGLAAFEARDPARTAIYSFEQEDGDLDAEQLDRLRADDAAWTFWQAQPPSYRRTATYWIRSAKRPETRARRLDQLVADSAAGLRIGPLRRPEAQA